MPEPPAPGPYARLLALHEDVQPADYCLEGDVCTLGRSSMCQIVVPRPVVSRLHAQVERAGPRYLLKDMSSANGTFVNGQRINAPHLLADRDLIGLGAATALLRFADPDPTVVSTSRLRYDEPTMRFFLGPQPVELTPTQFRLLLHLYQHRGELCTRESCAQAIWGPDYAPGLDADTLDRAISTLRSKLRQLDPTVELIRTRPGLGYILTDDG